MGKEAILSELRNRGNTLFMSFRNLGSFYVDGYKHIFSAIAGPRGDKAGVRNLEARIKSTPELRDFKINDNTSMGFDEKVAAFEVVQLEAPIWFGSDNNYSIALRKQGKLEKGKNKTSPLSNTEFFIGHYKKQAEGMIGPVGAMYMLDDRLAKVLQFNKDYKELAKDINHRHKLGEAIAAYDGTNFKAVEESISKKDFEENSKRIKKFSKRILELKKKLEEIGLSHVGYNPRHTCFDTHFDFDITDSKLPGADRKYIQFKRMRNLDEILSDSAANFDIEKFEFDSPEERVDLVVLYNLKNGKMSNKRLLTRYPTKRKQINGFKMDYCKDAKELVGKATDFINGKRGSKEESFVLTAYYMPFDSIQMREEGKFEVGSQESDPKKEVTTKFFEKIGVYGKHVIDPLDIFKVKYDHLPNKKMDMIGKELGVGGKTGLNYRQTREISIMLRTGKTEQLSRDTKEIIAKRAKKEFDSMKIKELKEIGFDVVTDYATIDGIVMANIQKTKEYIEALEDRVYISNLLQTDPFKLFHDPNRVNDSQDRSYFENVGLHRDDVYRKWKIMIDYEKKAMARFKKFNFKSMGKIEERGLFENVYKVYVPLTRFLAEHVARNFPEIEDLIRYTDQFSDDRLRQADLAHFEDALCKLMVQDYAICMMERDNLFNLLKKTKKDVGISDSGLFDSNFDKKVYGLFYGVRNRLEETEDKKRYRNYNITQKILEDCLDDVNPKFLEQERLTIIQLQKLFNQWAKLQDKERKVYGNYGVRAFFNPYAPEKDISSIEEALDRRSFDIFKFITENDLRLMHVQGNYLYLKGDKDALFKEDCPFFLVDELDKVLMTAHPSDTRSRDKNENVLDQKIYYEKNGFFEGISVDEEPTNKLTIFEMETYGSFIDNVLKGDYEDALTYMYDALDCMVAEKIPKENLVWMSKSKKRYRALEDGERIYFYTDEKLAGEKKICFDDDKKRNYVWDSIGKKKVEGKWVDNIQKVYIMKIDDLKPDWYEYRRRIEFRTKDLLETFIGRDCNWFIEEIVDDKKMKEIADSIRVY
ncbi:hypothetical protein GOV06_03910 [Candidatus Woesearchaeota archaeon]|nr:hypothetical protein [Candidatus Woesearchaeota archaeon]